MRRSTALGAAFLVVCLLVATQLVLPGIAAHRVRDELRGTGPVQSVQVSAFPALKLLWGHADRVRIRLGAGRIGAGDVAGELRKAQHVGRLDFAAASLALGPLRLQDVRLEKVGARVSGQASISRTNLAAVLPPGVDVKPVSSGGGQLVLEARAGLVAVRARLEATRGALYVAPEGLLGSIASLRVYSDPRLAVTGVGARPAPGGWTLTASGKLT